MEINIATDTLKSTLGFFNGFTAKEGVPASNYVKIEAKEEGLVFYGTDTDVSLKKIVDSENFETLIPGSACVKLSTFSDLINNINSDVRSVRIKEEENKWVSVRFGKNVFKIATMEIEHFPEIDFHNFLSTVKIDSKAIEEMIDRTFFAVVEVLSNYNMAGINLILENQNATATATDGFRIASLKKPFTGNEFSILLPKKAAQLISKILSGYQGEVELTQNDSAGFLILPNLSFSFRKLNGKFPDVSIPLATSNERKATADISQLKAAVSRATIFADEKNFSSIKFTFSPNELRVHAQSLEEGIGDEFIPIKYEGPETSIKFKSSFILEFLNAARSGNVCIEFSESPKIPTIWKMEEDEDYKCLILKLV